MKECIFCSFFVIYNHVSSKLAAKECSRDKEASSSTQNTTGGCPVVVTNPMSVSVPNLACSDANNTLEPTTASGLLETFTAMARRRTLGLCLCIVA